MKNSPAWILSWLLWGACVVHAQVAAPVIDPAGGPFTNVLTNVTLACATPGAAIYYTMNGPHPTETNALYTNAPLTILSNTWLKARAILNGVTSALTMVKFTFNPQLNDPRDYPNLIFNPSFEVVRQDRTGAQTDPEDWQPRSPIGVLDTNEYHSGVYSWRFTGPSTNYTFVTLSHGMPMALIPGKSYRCSFWVKTSAALTAGRGIGMWVTENTPAVTLLFTPYYSYPNWTKASAVFTAGANHVSLYLRLQYILNPGEVVWIDDLSIEPLDGVVTPAPAPQLAPNGGAFNGPVMLTCTSAVGSQAIRFTTDGADVTPWSYRYCGGYELRNMPVVKAQNQHFAYSFSPVLVSSNFVLRPVLTNGVPFYGINWRVDSETWWRGHPLNPRGTNYWSGAVVSPSYTIDVAVVRAANPTSDTAGIREAVNLAMRQPGGATLWFPASGSPYIVNAPLQCYTNYYVNYSAIPLLRVTNLHFIGETTNVVLRWDGGSANPTNTGQLFGLASMGYPDSLAAGAANFNSNRSHNIYFKNLVFDGCGSNVSVVTVRQVHDVMFDRCRFIRLASNYSHHPGSVEMTTCSDNLIVRDCLFDTGQSAFYVDGIYGATIFNCVMTNLSRGAIIALCNDDMAPYQASPRYTQYLVMSGNTCYNDGDGFMTLSGGRSLCADNKLYGAGRLFYGSGKPSATVPRMRYVYNGNIVRRNQCWGTASLAGFEGWYENEVMSYYQCDHRVESNVVYKGLNEALYLNPNLAGKVGSRILSNILIRANYLGGASYAQTTVFRPEVANIRLERNTYTGNSRALLVDTSGKLEPGRVIFTNNDFNPVLGASIFSPPAGLYPRPVDVSLTHTDLLAAIRWTTNATLPVALWTSYTNPVRVTPPTTLWAQALKFDGLVTGVLASAQYIAGTPSNPAVTITDPVATTTVHNGITQYTIRGTNNASTLVWLTWTNALTGGAGIFRSDSPWAVAVDLGVGTNGLTIRGSNFADVVCSAQAVIVRLPPPVIRISSGPHGGVNPSGDVSVAYGQSTQFVVRADDWFHITSLTTNGLAITQAYGLPVYTVRWEQVQSDGTLAAQFAEDRAPAFGTPFWWLAEYGLTNGGLDFAQAETNDADADTFANWQEYVTVTDPTNAGSWFGLALAPVPTGFVVRWSNAADRVYTVQYRPDLRVGAWSNAVLYNPASAGVLNFTSPAAAGTQLLRIGVSLPAP